MYNVAVEMRETMGANVLKVAEHSFARCGCVLTDARRCARKDAKKKQGADTTIISFFSIIAVLYRLFYS